MLKKKVWYSAWNKRLISLSNFHLHVRCLLLLLDFNVIKFQYFEEFQRYAPHYDNLFRGSLAQCFPNILLADPFPFRKTVMYSHLLAHVNIKCPDDGQPKLRTYIS